MMANPLLKKKRQSKDLTDKEKDELAKGIGKVLGVEATVKRPSKQLEKALDALALDFAKLQTKVDTVFTIGRKEDYSDREIGNMIRERMKDHYSAMTIWRVFEKYPDARQQQNHEKVNKKLTLDEKKEPDNAKIAEIDKKYVGLISEIVAKEKTAEQKLKQEQEPEAVYQMDPSTYRTEDLEQYDKLFLCEIIRYLEKRLGI